MKNKIIIIALSIFMFSINNLKSQTQKVLLESFTGAHCGSCPMGAYTLDSLLNVHPNLVAVNLHTYFQIDSMFFPEIEIIGTAYAPGAPVGSTNRIYWGSSTYIAETMGYWGSRIESEIIKEPEIAIFVDAEWNSLNREISAMISTDILSDLPSGDYRFSLYVIEDSVSKIGNGYDQSSYFNNTVGNPFYGLGNPIVGYVHKHVVRAILPETWGQAGIIPSNPLTGQNFSTTINYILPNDYDENKIKLVAFVNKYSVDHMTDKVLNVEEIPLIQTGTSIKINNKSDLIKIYPNPAKDEINIDINQSNYTIDIIEINGKTLYSEKNINRINISGFAKGIYLFRVTTPDAINTTKLVVD